jgi:hypothetical protein
VFISAQRISERTVHYNTGTEVYTNNACYFFPDYLSHTWLINTCMLMCSRFGGLVVTMLACGIFGGLVVSMLASGTFGGLVISILTSGTQVRGFKPGRSRRIFPGEKNPQHAFLRRGSRAVCPMSQICDILNNSVIKWQLRHKQNFSAISLPFSSLANRYLCVVWSTSGFDGRI